MIAPQADVSTLTDEEIVSHVLEGDKPLFEQLMRRNNRRVYRAARSIVRNDGEAEDVMQDTYVRAYEHLPTFERRSRFSTWITRIAIHEALARVRRSQKHDALDAASESSTVPKASQRTPEESASDGEMRGVLERAIDALPDDFRAVFMLRAVEEMSGSETAACLGIPEETVKTRFHRARTRLQEIVLSEIEPKVAGAFDFAAPRCDRIVAAVLGRLAPH